MAAHSRPRILRAGKRAGSVRLRTDFDDSDSYPVLFAWMPIIKFKVAKRVLHFTSIAACVSVGAISLGGCAWIFPSMGPSSHDIEHSTGTAGLPAMRVVDVDAEVTHRLVAQRSRHLFSEVLSNSPDRLQPMGLGDLLAVSIWEATPATLFGSVELDSRGIPSPAHATTLPEQPVDGEGCITVPFAGRVPAAGKTLPDISAEIQRRLTGKANQPEVLVLQTRNVSSTVTVVGEVTTSTRVPLTATHERLLDALALAAGVRQPVNKTTIQITRGNGVYALPLETIIRDPRQNIPLQPGDVITAMFQPLSFTALGATGKNDEISFETQGISLAQALARSGGLIDQRSNPHGVFVFRLEPKNVSAETPLDGMGPVDDLTPVIYRIDLKDPRSLFWIQSFPIKDRDVLYVTNAPITELQKFLNLLFTFAYPVLTGVQATR
jgi:polysaccharide export outer membrane protein